MITREEMENAAKNEYLQLHSRIAAKFDTVVEKGNSSIRRTKTKNNIGKSIGKDLKSLSLTRQLALDNESEVLIQNPLRV